MKGEQVDPESFGISGRTIIERTGPHSYAIVIDRKSRIIMADGMKIAEKAGKIKSVEKGAGVILRTTAPVCSKTLAFLTEKGIKVEMTIDNG